MQTASIILRIAQVIVSPEIKGKSPNNPSTKNSIESMYTEAERLAENNDYLNAVHVYEAMLELYPWEANGIKRRLNSEVLDKIHHLKDPSEKADILEKIIQNYPNSEFVIEALFRLAQIQKWEFKDIPRAIETYYKIINNFPLSEEFPEALISLGELHERIEDYPNAIFYYNWLVEEYPWFKYAGTALLNIGVIYEFRLLKYEKAVEAYKRIVKEYPDIDSYVAKKRGEGYNIISSPKYGSTKEKNTQVTPSFFTTSKIIQHIADIYKNELNDTIRFRILYDNDKLTIEEFPELEVCFVYSTKRMVKTGKESVEWEILPRKELITVVPGVVEILDAPKEIRKIAREEVPKPSSEIDIKVAYPNGKQVYFLNATDTIYYNDYVIEAIEFLPKSFLKGLKLIAFSSKEDPEVGGRYYPQRKLFIVYKGDYPKMNILIHELLHHWDDNIAIGKLHKTLNFISDKNIFIPLIDWGDPSMSFYKISWNWTFPFISIKGFPMYATRIFEERREKQYEYVRCDFGFQEVIGITTQNPHKEDFAFFGTCYATYQPKLWEEVEKEMGKGNFELAAKYLFMKYATPFLEKKSQIDCAGDVCVNDPFYEYKQIKGALNNTLRTKHGSVPESTVEAIEEIEGKYIKEKYEKRNLTRKN